jgi:pimeloyl-ACP methyl ester carboxylesterase
MTILGAAHGFLEVEPHTATQRRPDREVVLLLHGTGGSKDDWRFPQWRDLHYDTTHPPAARHTENRFTPPLDLNPFSLSDMRTDLRCWTGVLKALGHTVINYSQDGNQDFVEVPLAQFESLIVPFIREEVLVGPLEGKRIVVLGHSRGGILIRAYLNRHAEEGAEWIRRIITVCSPHRGTRAPLGKERLASYLLAIPLVGLQIYAGLRFFGTLDETDGHLQLVPDNSLFDRLVEPSAVPDIDFFTFGGTSPRYTRVYSWFFTPDSYVPNWRDFPDLRFDWTQVPLEMPFASPMLDAIPDALVDDEQDNGKGDGAVADRRSRLSGAPHRSLPINHAEAFWDEHLLGEVVDLLGTPLTTGGRVDCGRPTGELSFTPQTVTFGSVPEDVQVTRTVRVKNTTGSEVSLSFAAAPSGMVFQWRAFAVTLPDGEEASFNLQFRPVDNAIRTEELKVESTALGSPHSISLVGKGIGGIPPPGPEPLPTRLRFSPTVITFGSVAKGDQAQRGLTIHNDTGRSVTITIAASAPSALFRWPAVQAVIPTGAVRQITLTFKPQTNAIVSGQIRVASDLPSSPNIIGLVGKGIGGIPTPEPTPGVDA